MNKAQTGRRDTNARRSVLNANWLAILTCRDETGSGEDDAGKPVSDGEGQGASCDLEEHCMCPQPAFRDFGSSERLLILVSFCVGHVFDAAHDENGVEHGEICRALDAFPRIVVPVVELDQPQCGEELEHQCSEPPCWA